MLGIFEYIWLDAFNNFRSKTKVMEYDITLNILNQVPLWNYDGSSTNQAEGSDSEIFMKPVSIFKDPFRRIQLNNTMCYLVWCETFDKNMNLLKNSNRTNAAKTFDKYKEDEPWFGLEQEYFIINPQTNLPVGFNVNSNPKSQGNYYCGVGPDNALCRMIPEMHLSYCLYAGIKIGGINAEVAPAQWEYQIGPLGGIDAGDHLWVSRYILNRVAEYYGYNISYHPKPLGINTEWNGSGCHTNFSTKVMRENNGIKYIYKAINRLSNNHNEHMLYYGEHNKLRLTGFNETSSFDNFTFGRANRNKSIRIPNMVLNDSKGYFEDRRPSSNCDPYLVTSLIMNTCMNPLLDSVDNNNDIEYNIYK
jgi:glutamine synthetase